MYLDTEMALKHREPMDCAIIALPKMDFWNNPKKTEAQKRHIKDRAQTLQAGINLSYQDKLSHARKVIHQALEVGVDWALSYSGGRDSTALSHMMVEILGHKEIPHVMSNTRMEYPETIKMMGVWYRRMRAQGVECVQVFPDQRPKELWPKIGVPLWSKELAYKYRQFARPTSTKIPRHTPEPYHEAFRLAKSLNLKITEKCCDYLKKKPMKAWGDSRGIKGNFTGVRCSESRARRLAWITRGALYQSVTHGNRWIANPLAFWTEADVTNYLALHGIEVLAPDTLNGGSGCVTCMFGCSLRALEKENNNMQDLKTRNPKMWKAALDDWGYREVLDKLGIPYE